MKLNRRLINEKKTEESRQNFLARSRVCTYSSHRLPHIHKQCNTHTALRKTETQINYVCTKVHTSN